MASSKPYLTIFSLLFFFLFLSLSSTPAHSDQSSDPSVYDILPEFGLPPGLLPNCVVNYTFSSNDGSFSVELKNPCYVEFEYLVYYDKHITGTLKMGSIKNLKGIQVKRFFLWLGVDEIKVDLPPSDSIYFQVGIVNKKLRIDQFETVHSCTSGASVSGSPRASWKRIFELPPPLDDEIHMLLTE